jgi:hypothetical protein
MLGICPSQGFSLKKNERKRTIKRPSPKSFLPLLSLQMMKSLTSHGAPNANTDYTAIVDKHLIDLCVRSPRSHLKAGVATEPGENKTLPNQEKTFLGALALHPAGSFEVRAERSTIAQNIPRVPCMYT